MKSFISFLFLFFPAFLFSQIIHIPDDYPTIQEGIDMAKNGDTVLVAEGTYVENINFNGKNITVASHYLTTLDASNISQTIIDGNQNGSVVTFENSEEPTAMLNGFTLTNGSGFGLGQTHGGGIYLSNSSPILTNLIVSGNVANSSFGAGICCWNGSNPLIENVVVKDNDGRGNVYTNDGSGGISMESSRPILRNVAIYNNKGLLAGGMFCSGGSTPALINVTIANNMAYPSPNNTDRAEFISWQSSSPTLINTIIWNDSLQEIIIRDHDITIEYSNIQGGEAGIENYGTVHWLEGNMDQEPLFSGSGDHPYQLGEFSPCIDAGTLDTTGLYLPKIDLAGNERIFNDRVDMGAYEVVPPIPINQICEGQFGENVFPEGDFGSGIANVPPNDPQFAPDYLYVFDHPPHDGEYTITNDMAPWTNTGNWLKIRDNSTDPYGYMMVVNGRFELCYEMEVDGLCENTIYEFSADFFNLIPSSEPWYIKPDISVLFDGVKVYDLGVIPQNEQWNTYSFTFYTSPGQTSLTLALRDNELHWWGNDFALDNISFRPCEPEEIKLLPQVASFLCEDGTPVELVASIEGNPYGTTLIQWQQSLNGGATWLDIPEANDFTYVHTDLSGGDYYYRFLLANGPENLLHPACRLISNVKEIHVIRDCYKVYIPNVFSPNFDGINDYFTIYGAVPNMQEIEQLLIMDRWGGLVYEQSHFAPNEPGSGWDGTMSGKALSQGVYSYKATVHFLDGKVRLYTGTVSLMR